MKHKQLVRPQLDIFGFTVSFLCALHCMAIPVLLAIGGFSGLYYLADPWVEKSILLMSFLLAIASLLPSYFRKHKKPQPLVLMWAGFTLIFLSHSFLAAQWEAFGVPAGAILVGVAHYANWKLLKTNNPVQ